MPHPRDPGEGGRGGTQGSSTRTNEPRPDAKTALAPGSIVVFPGRQGSGSQAKAVHLTWMATWTAALLAGTGLFLLGAPAHGAQTHGPSRPAAAPFALSQARVATSHADRVDWLTPTPIRLLTHRDATLLLGVRTPRGLPFVGPVHVRMAMATMPMGEIAGMAREVGPGIYRIQTDLAMPGPWYALVTVGSGARSQVQALPLTVSPGASIPWRVVLPVAASILAVALGLFWLMTRSPGPGSMPPVP